jgi:hypothetical protein
MATKRVTQLYGRSQGAPQNWRWEKISNHTILNRHGKKEKPESKILDAIHGSRENGGLESITALSQLSGRSRPGIAAFLQATSRKKTRKPQGLQSRRSFPDVQEYKIRRDHMQISPFST